MLCQPWAGVRCRANERTDKPTGHGRAPGRDTVASDTPIGDHPIGGHAGNGATRRIVGVSYAPAATPPAAEPADDTGGEAWALVQAAQSGDASAFGALYDRYVDSVFRYVLF